MAFNNLRKLAVFALSAAMIVSLGACGTSEKSDSAASSDSESSSNTTGYDVSGVTKDDDIAAMLPESVTKDGKLTVGMDTSYAPAEFLAEDGKTPVGFDVDIAKAVQAALQKLMDDGTYVKILKHWGVENGAIDKAEINPTDLG
jgi:polar amino acid transport system substrate-binding protein|nr:transporter substrate-binding domain-containing protein [Bifidobacterium pseudocatenulatum]